jgi:N-ethylmaleimide reductase
VAPSAIAARGEAFTASGSQPFVVPRALATDEIAGVIAQFEDGARRALAAGFDGVEIHGANGYLIDQFLRDGSNRRTDRYGGSVLNRARFLLEVTEAVAGVWGAGRVGVRLSPWSEFNDMRDSDPRTTFGYAARVLAPLELAYLHLVEPVGGVPAGETPLAPELKAAFRGPLMINGGDHRGYTDYPALDAALAA